MISFDYLTLKAFYEENNDFFCGARLQKIQQPTRRDFVFTLRGNNETRKLYINIDPQVYHICFLSDKTSKRRNITIPKKPPMFCMLLRKHLEGYKITKVNVPPYERIFEIYFESYNELNEKINLCLAIELMGKYSNVILYNSSTNIIIGCAHNVGSEKSRDRELAGTLPYVYPPKQQKSDILHYFGTLNYDCLNDDFMGISLALEAMFKKHSVSLEQIKDYIELKKTLSPAYNEKEFSVYSELLNNPIKVSSVNEMIDEYYSNIQEQIIKRALRLKLKNIINPHYKKQKTSSEKLLQQLTKKDNASKYKKYADLIMSNLYNSNDYTKVLKLIDWESNEEVEIPLDETKTLKENSQKYYALYSKSKNAKEKLSELLNTSQEQQKYLEQLLYTIDNATTLTELYEILSECEDLGYISKPETNIKDKDINVDSTQINGFKIYIGKNNRQNDLIVSKLSSADDYWFHTQNCPGSHILLKISDNKQPDEATIYECCKLAKQYSAASKNTKAGVIYTKRKYLKKPPHANLGYVIYKNEKEIIVNEA